jgi:hypothetical protein
MKTPTAKNKTQKKRRWSQKYKKSINCNKPRSFSQKQYCKFGRKLKKIKSEIKNNELL